MAISDIISDILRWVNTSKPIYLAKSEYSLYISVVDGLFLPLLFKNIIEINTVLDCIGKSKTNSIIWSLSIFALASCTCFS